VDASGFVKILESCSPTARGPACAYFCDGRALGGLCFTRWVVNTQRPSILSRRSG
jgi:hypothetical protein